MPNHCFNRLEIYDGYEEDGPNPEEIYKLISNDPNNDHSGMHIDFNKIIPMPEILHNTMTGSCTITDEKGKEHQVSNWIRDEDGKKRLFTPEESLELEKIGYNNWYDWSVEHWGTKWNAYDQELIELSDETLIITFDTAWGPPGPIFEELKQMFPNASISGHYIGECNEFAGVF